MLPPASPFSSSKPSIVSSSNPNLLWRENIIGLWSPEQQILMKCVEVSKNSHANMNATLETHVYCESDRAHNAPRNFLGVFIVIDLLQVGFIIRVRAVVTLYYECRQLLVHYWVNLTPVPRTQKYTLFFDRICEYMMSTKSCRTQSTSNLCRMGSVRSTFSVRLKEESYLPPIGLAAAITAQRACRDVTIPTHSIYLVSLIHTFKIWLTCFRHRYGLLLHGLVNRSPVLFTHLVKLVDKTYTKKHTHIHTFIHQKELILRG